MSEPEIQVPLKFWELPKGNILVQKETGEDGLLRYVCVKPYKTIEGKIEKQHLSIQTRRRDMPTTSNKAEALSQLEKRKADNKGKNWSAFTAELYAGSNMYFGCLVCNGAIVLPESYQPPRPKLCNECEALKEMGWLE